MPTMRQVGTATLRKLGIVHEGHTAPDAYHMNVFMEVASSLYLETLSRGLYGRLTPVMIEADYTAGENERIVNLTDTPVTITFPETITPDDDEERLPLDLSVVQVANNDADTDEPSLSVYETPMGGWISASALTLDSYAPFSCRGLHGLACWIALRMADEGYAAELSPVVLSEARRFHGSLAGQFDSPRETNTAEFF
jgi:hypothetical protein